MRMGKIVTGMAAGLVGIAVLVASVSPAAAFNPRVPQIVFNNASLQGYLAGADGGINTATDQVDGQVWTTSISGNATFTLMIELSAAAAGNAIGVYNVSGPPVPPLFQIFPGAATAGWFATAHFGGGNLVVTLFDNNSIIQGQNFYPGVDANGFGFYVAGPGGTFYSEDARNPGGNAQVLTYLGTGNNFGDWWQCFEDSQFAPGDKDFEDVVLLLQSVVPTPNATTSWGRLKSLYLK
jgi:hypothetical protein